MEKKEQHITLLQEEANSLDEGREICIYEDNDTNTKIFIRKEMTDEEILKQDILFRYNNEEYWDREVLIE